MQREPVPPRLIGGERLTAPFAVHPGLSRDLDRLAVDGEAAGRLEKWLAVIIRRLLVLRFLAVAMVALQHQRPVRVELQVVREVLRGSAEREGRDGVGIGARRAVHLPDIDPGSERTYVDA